ncbi:MAG TPA: autotransporter domain-containing protein [Vitreimonas sp.]|uniref:autotransporter family protein n=1 Tax=Vitreimonas sp. TaxID=3069702 RepID=UPI002D621826|nr:autotransporter domain-containing protein [Vitreimonas sp.]HYD89808.1 autotransporter domain-containing protein [Vitreimonas sp.]
MRQTIRKAALHASTALAAAVALAPNASAHTDSLGFVISAGSGDGLFNVNIFYGSWHNGTGAPEGALDLTNVDTNTLVGTNPFQLVPGFDGVSDGTMPAGLTPGVNYFFPDGMGGLSGDPSGHYIYAFQYVTFLDLLAGSYTFGYNAGSSFTANWEPSDPMINAGAFIIDSNGQLVIIGAGPATIDTSRITFTSDEFAGAADLIFDGGTLQIVGGSQTVASNFTVNTSGGTIDTNLMDSTFDGGFSGDGVISVVGDGVVTLTGVNTNGGFIANHAGIAASNDAALGADGAVLTLSHGSFTALDTMTIERDIVIDGGHGGEIIVGDDLTLTLNGAISGSSCLYKRGLGELDLRANGSNAIGACVEEGEMAFNSIFTGNVWVDPGAFMSGAGQIVGDVEVSGTLSPGNSPGQLVVAGSVTQLPGSTLQIDIDGLTIGNGAGHYDTLVLTGATSVFTADGTLAPILRGITAPANNTFTPSVGDTFTIVTAEGGVAGAFDALTQPASGLATGTRFDVIYGDDTIVLAVTASDYSLLTGGRANARSAAAALQTVRPAANTGSGDVGAFFDGLAGYDEDELALVFQQVSGDIHATGIEAAHRNSRVGRETVFARLAANEPARQIWGEIVGADAEVSYDRNANGYDYRNGGMIVGADAPAGNWIVGGALAYVEGVARGDGRAEVQSYQAMGYARWSDGALFTNSAIAYSVDRYDIDRSVALSTGVEALTSSADGETVAVDFEFGRIIQAWGAQFDLSAGVSWDQTERDSFAETGDGAVALSFDNRSDEATRFRFGARYSREAQAMGLTLRPYAQAYVVHSADAGGSNAVAALHGATFKVESSDPGQTGLETGLGFVAELGDRVELYAHYRGDFSDNETEHGARLGARLAW